MTANTKQVLSFMKVVAWIVYIGLCIKTGAFIFTSIISVSIDAAFASNLYQQLDLSALFEFNHWYYIHVVSLIAFLLCLKATIFYLVIKIFSTINFVHPFSEAVSTLISRISYLALLIGFFTMIANQYMRWLDKRGAHLPDMQDYIGGAGEFLLLGGIIFMIAQVFNRGIEIQSENDLTV